MIAKQVIVHWVVIFGLATCAIGQTASEPGLVISEISSDKKYGFKKSQSIKVGSVSNEYAFMAQLTGPEGQKLAIQRLGSCCGFKSDSAPMGKGFLDRWEVSYEGLSEPLVLYLNGYELEEVKCPQGLGFIKMEEN